MGTGPWFKFYPADWLLDSRVSEMSHEGQGIYLRLLCFSWVNGGIPADEKKRAKLLGMPPKRLQKLWPQMSDCWQVEGDLMFNPRLNGMRLEYEERCEKSKIAIGKRWEAKRNQESTDERSDTTVSRSYYEGNTTRICSTSDSSSVSLEDKGVQGEKKQRKPKGETVALSPEANEVGKWWCIAREKIDDVKCTDAAAARYAIVAQRMMDDEALAATKEQFRIVLRWMIDTDEGRERWKYGIANFATKYAHPMMRSWPTILAEALRHRGDHRSHDDEEQSRPEPPPETRETIEDNIARIERYMASNEPTHPAYEFAKTSLESFRNRLAAMTEEAYAQ